MASTLRTLVLGSVLGLAAAGLACGGSVSTGNGELAAVWKRYEDNGTTVRDQHTFRNDGTFSFDEFKTNPADEDHVTGTWRKDGSELVGEGTNAKDGKRSRVRGTYLVNATTFMPGALLREGGGPGLTGVFTGTYVQQSLDANGQVLSTHSSGGRSEFRADHTVAATLNGQAREVTWEDKGGGKYRVILSSSGGLTLSTTFTLVDDSALGSIVYRKQAFWRPRATGNCG